MIYQIQNGPFIMMQTVCFQVFAMCDSVYI